MFACVSLHLMYDLYQPLADHFIHVFLWSVSKTSSNYFQISNFFLFIYSFI